MSHAAGIGIVAFTILVYLSCVQAAFKDDKTKIVGLRLSKETQGFSYDSNNVPIVIADDKVVVRVFGDHLTMTTKITFTTVESEAGEVCERPLDEEGYELTDVEPQTAIARFTLPELPKKVTVFYLCAKNSAINNEFIHQGLTRWTQIKTKTESVQLWLQITLIILCISMSCVFSGLNLGLMALTPTDLRLLIKSGNTNEKKYASLIAPVREHGNYLLASIVIANVLVNTIFTMFMDQLVSGTICVIGVTLALVMVGEIIPQAIACRHSLVCGAYTIYLTKFVMLISFPLSYPTAIVLNYVLGQEVGTVYNRDRLREILNLKTAAEHLNRSELDIIGGALDLRHKLVTDVMTNIEDVFMLDYEATLNFETIRQIMNSGFSRIPVYQGDRNNVVNTLYIKDLAFLDPDDNTPLKTLCRFYKNPCNFVFDDTTLDVMFREFRQGHRGHMAMVQHLNYDENGHASFEILGVLTLEDVIEELIQMEIVDETDIYTDNKTKKRRESETRKDFSPFLNRQKDTVPISPQLAATTFQFLSTNVQQFSSSVISDDALKKILKLEIYHQVKKSANWKTDPASIILQQGTVADSFVLILEGQVEVTVGPENVKFEGGPFTYFGTQALDSSDTPTGKNEPQADYVVRAMTDVVYLRIKKSVYVNAKTATLIHKGVSDEDAAGPDKGVKPEASKGPKGPKQPQQPPKPAGSKRQ